jgi:copper(I)-binding protein
MMTLPAYAPSDAALGSAFSIYFVAQIARDGDRHQNAPELDCVWPIDHPDHRDSREVLTAMKPMLLLLAAAATAGWLCVPSPTRATVGLARPPHALPASPVETIADKTYKVGPLVIEAPWARATPGGAQVGGGYLKITNTGAETDRLIGGSLPIATSVEVHEMSMTDGVMKMRKLEKGLEIKPGQTVELKPGGYHIMFMGLREGLKQGQPIKGTLVFEKAGSVEVEYLVEPIGAQSGGASQKRQQH